MRKLKILMLSLVMIFTALSLDTFAASNEEMRAAWVSTVYNMDWPKTKNNQTQQKKEYTDLLDKLKSTGINAVVVQVRPKADALYQSSINPWSDVLTGTQGKNPGYDPLPFLIDEAHKRGMEFHAWFNPYRITTSGTDTSKLASNHPARLNPGWVLNNGKSLIYNPGLPEVRKHVVDTVSEVVRKYNVDGVHFDDYFYTGGINDDDAYNKYGNGKDRGDWRRENVNTLLREVKSSIKSIKSNVRFGVSPRGIWRNKGNDSTGSDTSGAESYSYDYADTRAWIRQGLVDYITPQVYWPIGTKAADYSKLIPWWANEVKGTNVDLYIGQGVYKQGEASNSNQNIAAEIKDQINLNRKYSEVKGSIYFSARDIIRNTKLQEDMKNLYINNPIPSVPVKKLEGERRFDTAVKISKEGWNDGSDTVVLTSAYSLVDGVTATPLATTKNAPILLVDKNNVHESTKAELLRLKPNNIIVIGGNAVVNNNIVSEVKSTLPSANVNRVGGLNRYETSLNVAKEISKTQDINKVYIAGGIGEADALSIASKAGEDKQPIILSNKDSLNNDTYEWLKSNHLQDAYFIGGETVLGNSVVNKINSITTNNIVNNRIYGQNRYETNAKVMQKFYTNNNYNSVLVTKGDILVDALAAGPLASKLKSPIVLGGNSINSTQKTVLEPRSTNLVYQVGGGINQNTFNSILNLLK
ncbi:family 10 glycosylhydrolase [Clostridium sp. CCUG 7971]|uniref:family 10 glycosylhydrolase n=1 Tax=Clostridium sp. CCUG 7971 TaxID=2811414 RepID=UPI001ABB49A0|nr:family 10 glycosylhydrolase [Clostridium sp. CCUG 7971]MBO3443022.1 family 10 glycosylhydrolase [Clostridium sp. CCUG 7971]